MGETLRAFWGSHGMGPISIDAGALWFSLTGAITILLGWFVQLFVEETWCINIFILLK